jgi:ribose transport system permease protein
MLGGFITMTRVLGVLGLLLALYTALILSNPSAGKADNLIDVANIQGRYGLITIGAALVIIVGGIDLSIGSVVGCAAVLFGVLMEGGIPPTGAMAITLLFGLGVGWAHGLLITQLKLQPFLVTLCGMFIYRGVARLLGGTVSRTRALEAHPEFADTLLYLRYVLVGKDATGELIFPAQFLWLLLVAGIIGFSVASDRLRTLLVRHRV